jgi:hypothetical protein
MLPAPIPSGLLNHVNPDTIYFVILSSGKALSHARVYIVLDESNNYVI